MPPDRGSPYGYGQRPYGDGGDRYRDDPYGRDPYGQHGAGADEDARERPQGDFQSAVDALADPLSDPLPGQPVQRNQPGYEDYGQYEGHGAQGYTAAGGFSPEAYAEQQQDGLSPWFRPHRDPGAAAQSGYQAPPVAPHPQQQGYAGQGPSPYGSGPQAGHQQHPPAAPQQAQAGAAGPQVRQPRGAGPAAAPHAAGEPAATAGARPSAHRGPAADEAYDEYGAYEDHGQYGDGDVHGPDEDHEERNTRTVGLRRPDSEELASRAARRRAAQRRGKGSGARGAETPRPPAGTRLEARRAARARREGPAIIASRFLGEVFISAGVLMLLFVAYQLWWTNVLAGQQAGGAADSLEEQWQGGDGGSGKGGLDPERRADSFRPGEGFALLYIPKLDVRVPIAQGVSKPKVLDKGLVGHYDKAPVKTAMPWDKKGNFGLAGHRNTHGEPFRYINRLVAGDQMVVETATKFYTYEMANRLPSTTPSNTRVIDPIPRQAGFNRPGRYITLTTCTPEFTSKFRLIVWGKMVEERPRSKGKPDALVG